MSFLLFQTPFGLRLRAVGKDANAAYTVAAAAKAFVARPTMKMLARRRSVK